jgi:hypothetical protein
MKLNPNASLDIVDQNQLDEYFKYFNDINKCVEDLAKKKIISKKSDYLFNILSIKITMIENYINDLENKYKNNQLFNSEKSKLEQKISAISGNIEIIQQKMLRKDKDNIKYDETDNYDTDIICLNPELTKEENKKIIDKKIQDAIASLNIERDSKSKYQNNIRDTLNTLFENVNKSNTFEELDNIEKYLAKLEIEIDINHENKLLIQKIKNMIATKKTEVLLADENAKFKKDAYLLEDTKKIEKFEDFNRISLQINSELQTLEIINTQLKEFLTVKETYNKLYQEIAIFDLTTNIDEFNKLKEKYTDTKTILLKQHDKIQALYTTFNSIISDNVKTKYNDLIDYKLYDNRILLTNSKFSEFLQNYEKLQQTKLNINSNVANENIFVSTNILTYDTVIDNKLNLYIIISEIRTLPITDIKYKNYHEFQKFVTSHSNIDMQVRINYYELLNKILKKIKLEELSSDFLVL